MRKSISSILVLLLVITSTLSINVSAASNNSNEDVVKKTLTKEQYIKKLSEKENISEAEARLKIESSNDTLLKASGTTYQEMYTRKNCGAGFILEVGALVRISYSGNYRGLLSVDSTWSDAVGSGSPDWDQFYCKGEVQSANDLYLSARGNITVKVNMSTSAGAAFGSELVGASFTASQSVGHTVTYRKTVSHTKILHLY